MSKIYTTGADDSVWSESGHRQHWSGGEIAITPDIVTDVAKSLYSELGITARVQNPMNPSKGPAWAELSKKKVEQLAAQAGVKGLMPKVLKVLREHGIRVPSSTTGLSLVFYSHPGGQKESYASVSINTGNEKTGPSMATNSAQSSCPDGENNGHNFRCPLYGSGCYAELNYKPSINLNKSAGVNPRKNYKSSQSPSPRDCAEAEAIALRSASLIWPIIRLNNAVRVHVVGDCVTKEAARIVSDALQPFIESHIQGSGTRPDPMAKNVWNYTHGWRDVPRSHWPRNISVLASVDELNGLEWAHEQGYGCAVVVPDYVQADLDEQTRTGRRYSRRAYSIGGGWKLIPCPHEVADKNEEGEKVWCIECKLCLKDDWLRKNKTAIAFAAHTSDAKKVSEKLIQIQSLE